MARRVAIRVEDPDAWRNFGAALDELPVLPFRKIFGDAAPCGLATFRQLVDAPILSPELVLDAVRHKLGIGECRRVASPSPLEPQTWSGWKCEMSTVLISL